VTGLLVETDFPAMPGIPFQWLVGCMNASRVRA
jgi:hypothetical protein